MSSRWRRGATPVSVRLLRDLEEERLVSLQDENFGERRIERRHAIHLKAVAPPVSRGDRIDPDNLGGIRVRPHADEVVTTFGAAYRDVPRTHHFAELEG